LKLSTRARYALRLMIALVPDEEPVSLARVSESTHISRKYLEQVVMSLKNASLLRGVSGKRGGYVLARPPEKITAGEVIEAMIGPINIVDCVGMPESCLKIGVCECREVYVMMNRGIVSALNSFTLKGLAQMNKDHGDCAGDEVSEANSGYVPGGSPCSSE